ncbi:hypothetical protein THRCLA_03281 [Thraustotheca clavata]|uniref:ELMO domain-containing protein n=1 Tax=Thraustotheca clavata TaxID=74557 RepID=A0A1W0A2I8_9STRA|nr:hypothetical protein THRCLA_03281 [Thraustotheca clavata]
MDSVVRVPQLASGYFPFWTRWIRAITNFFCMCVVYASQLFWGQCELYRICAQPTNDLRSMMVRFRTSVALDSELKETKEAIFGFETFETDQVLDSIVQQKRIDFSSNKIAESNMRQCLKKFKAVNGVYAKVFKLRDESYDSKNEKHEEMLEELWENLKPGVRRTGGRYTKEWGEIGFQGEDPMTDFRSMGILSLHQLNYFTKNYGEEAKRALVHSCHPTSWYPFAVTGINITNFIAELIKDRLLDSRMYDKDADITELHEFYCSIYSMFDALWVESNPTDLMAFPMIFNHLKSTVRYELMERSFA